ncbi:MAG: membrane protein insertase YidC [Erysipelotrichales bacterium]|nr:membrane protein insertase YidC [Erysipelotrichales bacterium]
MNKFKKWFKVFAGLLFAGFFLSGCTANFCSNKDVAYKWYATYGSVEKRDELLKSLSETVDIPHTDFWSYFDDQTLEIATKEYNAKAKSEDKLSEAEILKNYGYALYLDSDYTSTNNRELWVNFDKIVDTYNSVSAENKAKGPTKDFITSYKGTLAASTQNYRTCITPVTGMYGSSGNQVEVQAKTWGDAWNKGLLEGLFVYPISWGVHQLSMLFGANGWGQLLAIIFITIIVRGLMMLVTFKSTAAQSKMTALQPELTKLQAKYPNSNTNQYEKQRLAQEQMELYKKHGINPLSQLLVLIIQFPVFICVWSALQGAAILTSDSVLGLELSASLGSEMINFSSLSCITAIVLFILMSGTQIVSMKLPQWMQKRANKKISKMGKNPAMDKTQSQTKMMSNIMLIMIIIMGISLPSAMGVYWLISALISLTQTLITQRIMRKKKQ